MKEADPPEEGCGSVRHESEIRGREAHPMVRRNILLLLAGLVAAPGIELP